MVYWIGAQGQVTSAKKVRKHAPIKTLPTENLERKKFFESELEDLPNPQRVYTPV